MKEAPKPDEIKTGESSLCVVDELKNESIPKEETKPKPEGITNTSTDIGSDTIAFQANDTKLYDDNPTPTTEKTEVQPTTLSQTSDVMNDLLAQNVPDFLPKSLSEMERSVDNMPTSEEVDKFLFGGDQKMLLDFEEGQNECVDNLLSEENTENGNTIGHSNNEPSDKNEDNISPPVPKVLLTKLQPVDAVIDKRNEEVFKRLTLSESRLSQTAKDDSKMSSYTEVKTTFDSVEVISRYPKRKNCEKNKYIENSDVLDDNILCE